MSFLNKMERKMGRFAIPNLMIYIIGAYVIGFFISLAAPQVITYLMLDPNAILHGQVWRLITWILVPVDSNILSLLIMSILYYQLGMALERSWGTFRFNAYIFGGMLFTVIGSLILYGMVWVIFGGGMAQAFSALMGSVFSMRYINLSIFLAFALMFPNMQILLMFIIPIKMKWLAIVYAALLGVNVLETFQSVRYAMGATIAGWVAVMMVVAIVMSLLNFLIFFLSTRNYKRVSPKEIHRRQTFKAQMRTPRPGSGITKHKCAVCGRTELDDPALEFRFCSKCDGNYEYCQEHLFTHQHKKIM